MFLAVFNIEIKTAVYFPSFPSNMKNLLLSLSLLLTASSFAAQYVTGAGEGRVTFSPISSGTNGGSGTTYVFNSNQFVESGGNVTIKDGAWFTNTFLYGAPNLPNVGPDAILAVDGSGNIAEVGIGSGLSYVGGTLSASGGSTTTNGAGFGQVNNTQFATNSNTLSIESGAVLTNITVFAQGQTWALSNAGAVYINVTNINALDTLVIKGRSLSTGGNRVHIATDLEGDNELDNSLLFDFGGNVTMFGVNALSNTFALTHNNSSVGSSTPKMLYAERELRNLSLGFLHRNQTNAATNVFNPGTFTAGANTLVVTNGNVGIGTATPASPLTVNGAVEAPRFTNNGTMIIAAAAGGDLGIRSASQIFFNTGGATGGTERWFISSVGHWKPFLNVSYDIGSSTEFVRTGYVANVTASNVLVNTSLSMTTNASLVIQSGPKQRAGNATLVGGTVTVANTSVTANTVVMLTRKTSGGTIGTAITYTLSAGTSFTITSDNVLDTSVFSYFLIEVQ